VQAVRLHKPGPASIGVPSACRFKGGYAMRTFDLSPLYRSTVGFDRLFSMLDKTAGFEAASGATYPPYNIERTQREFISRYHRGCGFFRV
jgi:hypothetical protein